MVWSSKTLFGGRCLWNVLFGDNICEVQNCGFVVVIYVDDLNTFKLFTFAVPNDVARREMAIRQRELHEWGSG